MKREYTALILIFLVVFAVRLYFVFSTPYFSYDAYFNIRQIEYITDHGKPLYNDPLSYSGRTFIFPPLFHYTLAFFNLFMPINLVGGIIPNLFISLLVIIVYLLTKEITKNSAAALFSAAISGFIPILFSTTINTVSPYTLLFPLFFYALYCLLKVDEDRKYSYYFIISVFLIPLVHQTAFFFMLGLLVYLILSKIENLRQSKLEVELIFFSFFVVLWIMFLVYKNALLFHGIAFVWQNTPKELLGLYFKNINILETIYLVGSIPLVLGIYVTYNYIFREKIRATYIFFGFALTTALLLWLKLVKFKLGLAFLGVLLTILFAQFYKAFFIYVEKTKVSKFHRLFFVFFVVLFIATSVVPSILYSITELKNSPGEEEIKALIWIKEKTGEDSVILSSIEEGHVINYFAQRKNLIDTNFLLIRNIDQRFTDFKTLFTVPYQTDVIRLLNKYEISYIYISKNTKEEFGVGGFVYGEYGKCFDELYDEGEVFIYESRCELEEG